MNTVYSGTETHRVKDTVCIYSGGMDSFTLAALTKAEGRLHSCLSFYYGQRHSKELGYAVAMCRDWGVSHKLVDLGALGPLLDPSGSALLGTAVEMPEGHYAEENMKQTVVPNRNMIMLSIAIAYAVAHKLKVVRFGAHAGDHEIYPDCRTDFVREMNNVACIANWEPVRIEAPFITYDKAKILEVGFSLDLDYGRTWTCYKGLGKACGRCGSCQERLEAFHRLGKVDPSDYESRVLLPKAGAA